jgi:cytokinin riboside 5'-monophosphate phosphoribohydrolase
VATVYSDAARRLGEVMADRGYDLVYGAGNLGLMGVMAEAVHAGGGRVTGVIPEKLRDLKLAWDAADELIVTANMRARKQAMEDRADAFIAAPGGLGTLEEVMEILVLKQLWYHRKALVFLNTAGFYDSLFAFLAHLESEHFVKTEHRDLFHISAEPEDAVAYIDAYVPPEPHAKWF